MFGFTLGFIIGVGLTALLLSMYYVSLFRELENEYHKLLGKALDCKPQKDDGIS